MTKSESLTSPKILRAALLQHTATHNNALRVNVGRFWAKQARELTLEQVEQMLSFGLIPEEISITWKEGWDKFISEKLDSFWTGALLAGSNAAQVDKKEEKILSRLLSKFRNWREARRVRLSAQMHTTQIEVVGDLTRALADRAVNSRDARRVVRQSLGLTRRQSAALVKIWDALTEENIEGLSRIKSVVSNASRLQSIRSQRIAQTELSKAFNSGVHEQMRERLNTNGILESRVVKKWVTAGDSKVCSNCRDLESREPVGFSDGFPTKKWDTDFTVVPPIHPSCRCVIEYINVS